MERASGCDHFPRSGHSPRAPRSSLGYHWAAPGAYHAMKSAQIVAEQSLSEEIRILMDGLDIVFGRVRAFSGLPRGTGAPTTTPGPRLRPGGAPAPGVAGKAPRPRGKPETPEKRPKASSKRQTKAESAPTAPCRWKTAGAPRPRRDSPHLPSGRNCTFQRFVIFEPIATTPMCFAKAQNGHEGPPRTHSRLDP